MKKFILLIIGLMALLPVQLHAQETRPSPWFPEDAEWYYGLFGEWELFGGTGCVHMTVAKDTLLADRPCKKLKLTGLTKHFTSMSIHAATVCSTTIMQRRIFSCC